jgi:hypothetical protein
MKKSLRGKYQFLMVIFFAIIILEAGLIFLTAFNSTTLNSMKADIQFIVILFVMIQFIYFIIMFYYVPFKYEQAFRELTLLIQEISEGKHEFDLELKTHNQSLEIINLMHAMKRMMNVIIRFDSLKTDKIFEHHQRIQLLINMIPEGCLLISIIGEIVYMNDFVKVNFPDLSDNLNIIETYLPEYIESDLKPIMIDSIKSGNNLHDKMIKINSKNQVYKLNSSIVRNRKGASIGAIFIIVKA